MRTFVFHFYNRDHFYDEECVNAAHLEMSLNQISFLFHVLIDHDLVHLLNNQFALACSANICHLYLFLPSIFNEIRFNSKGTTKM
jgi:hypothetical protein